MRRTVSQRMTQSDCSRAIAGVARLLVVEHNMAVISERRLEDLCTLLARCHPTMGSSRSHDYLSTMVAKVGAMDSSRHDLALHYVSQSKNVTLKPALVLRDYYWSVVLVGMWIIRDNTRSTPLHDLIPQMES